MPPAGVESHSARIQPAPCRRACSTPVAVEVGALDPRVDVGPVHHAACDVERDLVGAVHAAGEDILDVGAVEVGALDPAQVALGPVDLPVSEVERDPIALGPSGRRHQVLHVRAVEVGALDLVRDPVRPVQLAAVDVERDPAGTPESRDHDVLDVRAVEVGALDLLGPGVSPVHLAGFDIQGDPVRVVQRRDYQILDPGSVQVGAPDHVRAVIGPVHLAAPGVQRDPVRPGRAHQGLDVRAVQVGALNAHLPVDPVHLAIGYRQRDAVRFDQPLSQIFDAGAVQPGTADRVRAGVRPVDPGGRRRIGIGSQSGAGGEEQSDRGQYEGD